MLRAESFRGQMAFARNVAFRWLIELLLLVDAAIARYLHWPHIGVYFPNITKHFNKKVTFYYYVGCRYKGVKNAFKGLMDTSLPTINFSKSDSKDIRGLLYISQSEDVKKIMCEMENTTSFLNSQGEWVPIPDIRDNLIIRTHSGHGEMKRYLSLNVRTCKNSYLSF